MSDGKMSPEELESWLRPLEMQMGRPWTADALRAHIAALEKERDAALADNAALLQEASKASHHWKTFSVSVSWRVRSNVRCNTSITGYNALC